jgi:ribonucleoside-diphosphate reductase alpha chain
VSTKGETEKSEKPLAAPRRERLQDTRQSITHKFSIAGHEGYITVGLYPDGRPGELFITMAKEGSTIGGLMDCFGTAVSMSLQYGVPLEVYVNKFSHTRFEPMGHTKNPDIRIAKSIVDYIFRWLGITFLPGYREANRAIPMAGDFLREEGGGGDVETELRPAATKAGGPKLGHGATSPTTPASASANPARSIEGAPANGNGHGNGHANGAAKKASSSASAAVSTLSQRPPAGSALGSASEQFARFQEDAPVCDSCGAITVRNGKCYLCYNCGHSMGCS